jgi:hypothetical protein
MSSWHHNDLTSRTGAPDAPIFSGDPFGYVFAAQGTQHVIYRSGDGHIHELWWGADGWHHNDLTSLTAAPVAASDPSGYVFAAQGTQHVIYRSLDGHLHELWSDADGWHYGVVTGPTAQSKPSGYMFDAQGTQHVVYLGGNRHMHELWWGTDNSVHHDDLTSASGAPDALGGDPSGYVFAAEGTQHVIYNVYENGGHLIELWWGADNRVHQGDLTSVSGAPNATSNPSGYVFVAQGTQHVVYRGVDGHVHELLWGTDPGVHHNDLTSLTGAPNALQSDPSERHFLGHPSAYVFDATQHVVYRGVDDHIHELWWAADVWHHNDLTVAAGGSPSPAGNPSGYLFAAQGTQHVVYLGHDRHIHELWWG